MLDGLPKYYDTWAHGLAFTGGTGEWAGQPCGWRQAVIDFGDVKRFDRVLVWHHGDDHVPTTYEVTYWNGSSWLPVGGTSTVRYDLRSDTDTWGAVPTESLFPPVEGSKVRYRLNNCNITHGWLYEFEVFGQDVPREYAINLTSFIPGNNVKSPNLWDYRCAKHAPLYFRGDTRTFDPRAGSFRTRQLVTIVTDEARDADGAKDGTLVENLTGITRSYAPDALPVLDNMDDDAALGDCRLLHDIGHASNGDMEIVVTRLGPKAVRVHLRGSAANPLVLLAPSIDWNLELTIDDSTTPTTWTLNGVEDGFPAFELYVNDQPLYRRNAPPPYSPGDLMKLAPKIGDQLVNMSGTL